MKHNLPLIIQEVEDLCKHKFAQDFVKQLCDDYYAKPKTDAEFEYYLKSKLWRLNNIYKVDPKKGNLVPFRMKKVQLKIYLIWLLHKWLIILKSRQQGISTMFLLIYLDDIITRPYLNAGLVSYDIGSSGNLLKRVKNIFKEVPQSVKDYFGVEAIRDNNTTFRLTNNSEIVFKFTHRSSTLQDLHVSEMGKIAKERPDKAIEIMEGSIQTLHEGSSNVLESTGEGENLYKQLWDNAVETWNYHKDISKIAKDQYFPIFLSWIDDEDNVEDYEQVETAEATKYFSKLEEEGQKLNKKQKNFWIKKHNLIFDGIYKEFPALPEEAFYRSDEGTYYSRMYQRLVLRQDRHIPKIKKEKYRYNNWLYDENLALYCALDLGRNDATVLTLGQVYKNELRVIDEHQMTNENIRYYSKIILDFENIYQPFEKIIFPHDVMVKSLKLNDMTRLEEFVHCGINRSKTKVLTKKPNTRMIEIDNVRRTLHDFYINAEKCKFIHKCLLNYRKEYDKLRGVYKDDTPYHDKFSNGADSLRYLVRGLKELNVLFRRTDYEELQLPK